MPWGTGEGLARTRGAGRGRPTVTQDSCAGGGRRPRPQEGVCGDRPRTPSSTVSTQEPSRRGQAHGRVSPDTPLLPCLFNPPPRTHALIGGGGREGAREGGGCGGGEEREMSI